MILILARGLFCPKDHQQNLELAAFHPKIPVAYTKLVTISTDNILETNEFRDAVGAQWPFLSDPGRKVQKDLDIAEYTDPHHDPMIPHTFVLAPGLVIHKIYNGYWFWGRPSPEELRQDLRELTRKIPPTGTWPPRGCARRGRQATARATTPTGPRALHATQRRLTKEGSHHVSSRPPDPPGAHPRRSAGRG
jgi:peroxiredoxin